PAVNQPVSPPPAAVGNRRTRAAASRASGTAARSTSSARSATVPPSSGSANSYPGSVSCPQSGIPSPNPYAWECTHSDGTPVRWRAATVTMWADGLTVEQMAALRAAQPQWAQHTGISLVPASSSSSAQLLLTEVPTLDALPD